MIPLVVSIDTEEDNWVAVSSGVSAENARELPRLSRFLSALGIRPTFFVNYQVVCLPWAADILREIADGGRAEIAAHIHPWNTPPYDDTASARPTMLSSYPLDQQIAKVRTVTEAIAEATGVRPSSFRAGRFGVGPETITALIANGYRVDSSVTPFWSWEAFDRGPNFTGAPISIYRLDGRGDVRVPAADGPITEVPLSAGFTRFAVGLWPKLERMSRGSAARAIHLAGIAARTGFVRHSILSPEVPSVKDMLALSRCLVAGGVTHLQLLLHSSSLRPGLSPFVTSRADLDRLYNKVARYVEELSKLHSIVFNTVAEVAGSVAPAPSGSVEESPHQPPRAAVGLWQEPLRPRRLLVIGDRFPPEDSDDGVRWAGFSRCLLRRGWEVHVLTPATEAGAGLWQGVHVHRCTGGFLRTAIEARALVRRFRPGVMVTSGSAPALHLAGLVGALRTGIRLLLDLQDTWFIPSTGLRAQPRPSVLTRQVTGVIEDLLFESAQLVIADNPDLADALRERHPRSKLYSLRTGVDREAYPKRLVESMPGLGIAYTGVLWGDRATDPIISALGLFLEANVDAIGNARLRIVGDVAPDCRRGLAGRVPTQSLASHVELLGPVPRREVLALFAVSHLSVVLATDQNLRVPAELYDSLAVGVPTLVCADGESAAAREARRLGAVTREPDDIEGIARLLCDAWRGNLRSSRSFPEELDRETIAGRLESLLTDDAPPSTPQGDVRDTLEPNWSLELQSEPQANWMWLVELTGRDRALELTAGQSELEGALRLHFSQVRVFDWSLALQWPPAAQGPRGASDQLRLPYDNESFDFVTIHGSWPGLMHLAGAFCQHPRLAVLSECRRVLRPGGCLYIAAFNPGYRRPWALAVPGVPQLQSVAVAAMRGTLRTAGFSRWRGYYVTPSHVIPRDIIPMDRAALLRYERFTTSSSAMGLLRRASAAVGFHQVLHPSVAYLAYR